MYVDVIGTISRCGGIEERPAFAYRTVPGAYIAAPNNPVTYRVIHNFSGHHYDVRSVQYEYCTNW
jgi:hypothetical protein